MRTSLFALSLVLGVGSAAIGAREASANGCNAYAPFFANGELPLGCPLVVAFHPDVALRGALDTKVTAWRGGPGHEARVPLAATVTESRRSFDVRITTFDDDDCEEHSTLEPTEYVIYTVDAQDALVGDRLELGGQGGPIVTAAGPCPAAEEPAFYCTEPLADCPAPGAADLDDGGGCSAGGGAPGLAGIALALGLVARRRR